jgi:hypothetical protein
MGLTTEHVGPKILAKTKIYVLTRAELLFNLCYEIPCTTAQINIFKAKLLMEETFFIIIFTYLKYVDIQVQNRKRVLGSLVLSILDMGLAC